MAANNPDASGSESMHTHPYEFKAGFEGNPDKPLAVVAYVFSREGSLLASKPLKEGSVQLSLAPEQLRTARIYFGPEDPRQKGEKAITLDDMEQLHAYEAVWKFDPDQWFYELLPIPEYLWRWWFWCSCRVRGQVLKPVTVAGVTLELPVCNVRVHICEVDAIWWIIPRLPDPILVRLRDELLYEIDHPRPIPLPDPPPFKIDPGFIDPSPENIAEVNRAINSIGARVALNPQPLPPKAMAGEAVLRSRVNVAEASGHTAPLDLETRARLSTPVIPLLRQALQDNIALIQPYLCIWYWLWPYFCRCDEIAVLTTDANGRFDTTIWYFCFGDRPDLYFWVEALVGGSWTTVYHPNPICCYTYWNYSCGSDVRLLVTDPRVVPCGNPPPDLPGLQVAVLSIGQNVSMSEIPVDSTSGAPYSGTASEGLANSSNPFGGQLEPRVWFSRSALLAIGVTHYRWSYRQLTEGDGTTPVSDSWHAMDRQVIRHYAVINPITSALSFPAYPLGPDPAYPGVNLFQIQPINAPTGRPEDWAPIDAHEDLASAFFQSYLTQGGDASLGAGKYELKLELFNTSGAMPVAVNLTTSGIALKVANVPAPFGSGTVTTSDADNNHRFLNGSGETVAFRLVLHVDNNVCTSALYPISGAGLSVDADCGFIQYQPGTNAHISFMAAHPHDFATLSFSTVRGTATDVPDADAAGQLDAGTVALNGFARSAGSVFSKDVAVNTLLTVNTTAGHTPCTKAAFSEMLIVQAMATDGWQLLSYLNPSPNPKQAAYALEPA